MRYIKSGEVVQNSSMKKQTFLSGVMILFAAGVVAKVLGAIYRIPLTWLLGANGLGMYQLVYPLFSLILVLSSTGMPTAISRVTAGYVARGQMAAARLTLRISLRLLLVIGTIFALLLALGSVGIASLQGNLNLYICYLGLVPAVILVSVLSALRGYFQGCSNMTPTAASQLVEQGGKLIFGLLLGYLLLPMGIEYGTLGALLGVSVSELFAVAIMLYFYRKAQKMGYYYVQNTLHSTYIIPAQYIKIAQAKPHSAEPLASPALTQCIALGDQALVSASSAIAQNSLNPPHSNAYRTLGVLLLNSQGTFSPHLKSRETSIRRFFHRTADARVLPTPREIRKTIIRNVAPITLSNSILPSILFVESLFVILLLGLAGLDTLSATALWGVNSGIVGSLINTPIVLAQAVAVAIVPFVAGGVSGVDLGRRYGQATTLNLVFCVPMMIACVLLGEPIISLLYQSTLRAPLITLATQMLCVMSVSIIFGSLLQTQNNMLQGLGFGKITARNMAISAVVQIILFVSLTATSLNIWGCVIASVVFYIIAFLQNYLFIRFRLGLKYSTKSLVPTFCGALLLALYIINIRIMGLGVLATLILSILGGAILYLFALWVWGAGCKSLPIKIWLSKKRLDR